jgi:hypothetical protein
MYVLDGKKSDLGRGIVELRVSLAYAHTEHVRSCVLCMLLLCWDVLTCDWTEEKRFGQLH